MPPEQTRKGRILTPRLFREETLTITRNLLGKNLCRKYPNGRVERLRIFETEAYDGPNDKACHAAKGMTPRTRTMYAPGGYWYVYLCYGVHWMLNLVTGPKNYPAAVLLRGAGEVAGPGRLTRHLEITRKENTKRASRPSGLWIEDDGFEVANSQVERTPRIGIANAEEWIDAPYRFVWKS